MGKYAFAGAALLGVVGLLTTPVSAQEVKQDAKSASGNATISPVTQDQLNKADKSASNFLLTNGNYAPDALLSRQADRPRQREEPARRLDLPDRRQGIAGDVADRRRRRHVCDDLVQPCLRARRQDRRAALALQSQDGTDHDLLLRPEQSRRPGSRRHGLRRHARCQARGPEGEDRRGGLEDRDRRSGGWIQRDDGADRHQGQGADRHQWRRIRHPRLHEGL